MFLQSIRGGVYKLCSSQITSVIPKVNILQATKIPQPRCFHMFAPIQMNTIANNCLGQQSAPKMLTVPNVPQLIQSCGMKARMSVRRRCRDCYLVVRGAVLYNMCPTHPRHKQMKKHPKLGHIWILSHATQSKIRPW